MAVLLLGVSGHPDNRSRVNRSPRVIAPLQTSSAAAGVSPPAFAFTANLGTGAPCSGDPMTDDTAVFPATFTRASAAYCTISNPFIPDYPGSMVQVAVDEPRAMAGNTAGETGYLGEEERINVLLRSEAFDNAAWADLVSVTAAPTRTANAALAPNNAMTAERLQIPANASVLNYSGLYQVTGCPGGGQVVSGGLYLRGNGQSGTIDIAVGNVNGPGFTTCSYTDAIWTRCTIDTVTDAVGGFAFGSIFQVRPSQDFFVWGGQCEVGNNISSYIPTTAAAATRNEDIGLDFDTFSNLAEVNSGSMSFVLVDMTLRNAAGSHGLLDLKNTVASQQLASANGATLNITAYDGINLATVASGQPETNLGKCYEVRWSGTNLTVVNKTDAITDSETFTGPWPTSSLQLGTVLLGPTRYPVHGIIKNVCFDSSAAKCRCP